MAYVQIVLGLVKLASALAQYFERQGYLRMGEAAAIAEGMKKEASDVEIALKARQAARDAAARNPSSVLEDDGFRRPD